MSPLSRRRLLSAVAVAVFGTAGCQSPSAIGGRDTEAPPTTECTMRGGVHLWAAEVPSAEAANVTATDFDALDDAQRDRFLEMLDRQVKVTHAEATYPDYVRYNGTVYEVAQGNLWDEYECR